MLEQKSHHCSFQKKSLGNPIVSHTWKLIFAALAVALCLFPGLDAAQEETGEITGTIKLDDGCELPGLFVEVTGAPLEKKKITVSNPKGIYKFPALPRGSYDLVFKLEGIKTVKRKNVLVRAGAVVTLDIIMEWDEFDEVLNDGRTPVIRIRRSVKSAKKTNDVSKKPLARKKANREETGKITGAIKLDDGSKLPGVFIEVTGPNLVRKKNTVSNEFGAFRLPALPRGSYDLVFTLEGFKTAKRKNVHVRAGDVIKLDIRMEPGEIKENVHVCKSPAVDVRRSTGTTKTPEDVSKKLPRGHI